MRFNRRFTATLMLLTAAAPATRPTRPFANGEYGFRLQLPAGWIVPERPDEGQVFTVWMPLRRPPAAAPATRATDAIQVGGVGLRVEQGPAGQPDPQVLRDLTGAMAARMFGLGAKHVTLRPARLGELSGREVRFTIDRPGGPVAVLYVVGVHKGVEYVFNTAAPADQLEGLLPDVRAMLDTFELRD